MRDTEGARGKRRRFAKQYRRQVVEETLALGASIAGVALKHRLNANLAFTCGPSYCRRYFGSDLIR